MIAWFALNLQWTPSQVRAESYRDLIVIIEAAADRAEAMKQH